MGDRMEIVNVAVVVVLTAVLLMLIRANRRPRPGWQPPPADPDGEAERPLLPTGGPDDVAGASGRRPGSGVPDPDVPDSAVSDPAEEIDWNHSWDTSLPRDAHRIRREEPDR